MDYPAFVRERFKHYPGSLALTIHHATTGLVGEAIEVAHARSRDQLLKELGDYEFYLEALIQHLPLVVVDPQVTGLPTNLVGLTDFLIARSGDLLDLSKKQWVYEQDVSLDRFWEAIPALSLALYRIYTLLGTTRKEVLDINVSKLSKRYPSGYSNQAAQQRADGDPGGSVLSPNPAGEVK